MKVCYIVAVFAILLLVGCAQTTTPPAETTPPAAETTPPPAETTPPAEEAPPVEETPPAATPAEIEVLVKGYDPAELTVTKGTIVKFINTAPSKRILRGAVWSPQLQSGDIYEHTFEEAGEYVVIETLSKARMTITVTEE